MRISSILLSIIFTLKCVKSNAVDNNEETIKKCEGDVNKEDKLYEISNDNFQTKFHCINLCNNECNNFKDKINLSFDILSNTFEFKKPVVFESYYLSVNDTSLFENEFLGLNVDKNYIPLRTSTNSTEAPYSYPQALAKQLNLKGNPNFRKNDFSIIFNYDKVSNMPQSYPLEYLIIHEMMHGMGFTITSKFFNYEFPDKSFRNRDNYNLDDYNKYFKGGKYLPCEISHYDSYNVDEIKSLDELKKLDSSHRNQNFYPLTVFEKNIVDIKDKKYIFRDFENLYSEFDKLSQNKETKDETSLNELYKETYDKLNSDTKNSITDIYQNYLIKAQSIGILTKENEVIPLFTQNEWYEGNKEIIHTPSKYYEVITKNLDTEGDGEIPVIMESNYSEYYDENMLMIPGIEYEEAIIAINEYRKKSKHDVIGKGIVDIMKTLGWTEKGEKFSDEVYYVAEDTEIPERIDTTLMLKKYLLSENIEEKSFAPKFYKVNYLGMGFLFIVLILMNYI